MEGELLSVSEFHAFVNQTLSFAYPLVMVQGEVSSFKVNQGKWVFFDLKDDESVVSCFMPVFQLKVALADGMLINVTSSPNLTKWGKFSLTVRAVELAGEGSVKRAFELLKARFEAEGLFAHERKRSLPAIPQRVALITSQQAAAYNDFVTILNDRWAGLEVTQAQVAVQGIEAPAQIVRAIQYFNDQPDNWDVMVIIRGGGSAEDLQAFNHEDVVRAVYGSKVPTLVAIGHEDDVSLAELAADVRAATPTDAARRLTPDKRELGTTLDYQIASMADQLMARVVSATHTVERMQQAFVRTLHASEQRLGELQNHMRYSLQSHLQRDEQRVNMHERALQSLNPSAILRRGYSIASVHGKVLTSADQAAVGEVIMLQLHQGMLTTRRTKGDEE